MQTFDNREFRSALGTFATGVTIVTTLDGLGRDVGITANSFNSVSLEPPLVLWSLAKSARSLEAFTACGRFIVHLLAADQQALSDRFARSSVDKFASLTVDRGLGGLPLLKECSAWFECLTTYQYDGGDHIIFVGEVQRFEARKRAPLVFHAGRYAITAPRPHSASEPQLEGSYYEDSFHYLIARVGQQMMHALRPKIRALGFEQDEEYFLLAVLIVGDGRTLAEVNATFPYDGETITSGMAERLVTEGMLGVDLDGGGRLWLTDRGRELVIHGLAANKALEADALGVFDYGEAQVLKDMLHRLIEKTGCGIPDPFTNKTR